jgi:NAD-reducing hydrogenase large subunit
MTHTRNSGGSGGREARTRRIVIDPVTRIEGHAKVTIHQDVEGRVVEARLHVVEFRGFERFIQGRPFWEMPVAVQRLCGICPVSHHLCSAKALDRVVGVDQVSATAEAVRRLMHYGQIFQSHALHFFHLASPDLLFGADAPAEQRNLMGLVQAHPELARQGIHMRRWGQEIIEATAGRRIHGTGAVPGGVNRHLDRPRRDDLLREHEQMLAWSRTAVASARRYTLDHRDTLGDYGDFPANDMALVGGDGELELYDGSLRAVDPRGEVLFESTDDQACLESLAEEVRPWSYMKFPYLRALGPEDGWYRVGPLARLNVCDRISTPEAEEARQAFRELADGGQVHATMAYHWARMIELLHCAERIGELLTDPALLGGELRRTGERRREGVGIVEAPRGTLFHHYVVGEDDLVERCNLLVSTTSNNEAMNRSIAAAARRALDGRETITEGLLNRVEMALRAYDPCLSCATHALGRMPLHVELLDARGATVDRAVRDGGV